MAKRGGGDDSAPKRHRQEKLKGITDDVEIPELTEAGEAYEDAMLARVKKTKEETEASDALLAVMHKYKRTVYRSSEGLVVTLTTGKEKVKVKRADQDATEGATE